MDAPGPPPYGVGVYSAQSVDQSMTPWSPNSGGRGPPVTITTSPTRLNSKNAWASAGAEVDAAVGDVLAALAVDRPRRGVHVLAAVGDVHVVVDELVVAVGRVDRDAVGRRVHAHDALRGRARCACRPSSGRSACRRSSGTSRRRARCCVTVILNVARSAIDTRASPTVNCVAPEPVAPHVAARVPAVQRPHDGHRARPCGHNAFGRKCSS